MRPIILAALACAAAGCSDRPRTASEVDAEGKARIAPHLPDGWKVLSFSHSTDPNLDLASAEFEAPGLDGKPWRALATVDGPKPQYGVSTPTYECWVSDPGVTGVHFDFAHSPAKVHLSYGDNSPGGWMAKAREIATRSVELLKVGAAPYMD